MNHTRWIVLALFFAVAWAAPLTQLYDRLSPKLEMASAEFEKDQAASLQAVDDALNIFRKDAENVPEALSDGVVQSLKNARVAISRKSKADLESQLWVVRGSLGKMLYEAMFQAAYKGDPKQSLALLDRLVKITARTPDLKNKAVPLIQAGDIKSLRTLFERAYAGAIAKTLALAKQRKNRASKFALTAKAYGLYLVVQDSPRLKGSLAKEFVGALADLQSNDLASYNSKIDQLIAASRDFFKAAGAQAGSVEPATPAAAKPSAPGGAAQTSKPKPAASIAAPATAPKAAATPKAAAAAKAAPAAASKPVVAAPLVSPKEQLLQDVEFLVPDKKKAQKAATLLAQSGIYSYTDWRNSLLMTEGTVGSAIPYVASGNTDIAYKRLEYARSRYLYEISPLVRAVKPKLDKEVIGLFDSLMNAVGLRTTDINVLIDLLESVDATVLGKTFVLQKPFSVGLAITKLFVGLPRAVFFILMAILALFPLYLVWLTFGGRNVYWRLLGLAFLFLLLPAVFEGIGYFGDLLATYGGVPILHKLSFASIEQNVLAQTVWAILLFLVIVFATWGLRGIAIQFGLIQDKRRQQTTVQSDSNTTSEKSPTLTSETIVEWDEEF